MKKIWFTRICHKMSRIRITRFLRKVKDFFFALQGKLHFLVALPKRLHDIFVPRGCMIFFCPEKLRDFFCSEWLHDFLSRQVVWFFFVLRGWIIFLSWEVDQSFFVPRGYMIFCPDRLCDFFCPQRLHEFFWSWEVAWFFLSQEVAWFFLFLKSSLIFFVPTGCVSRWNFVPLSLCPFAVWSVVRSKFFL